MEGLQVPGMISIDYYKQSFVNTKREIRNLLRTMPDPKANVITLDVYPTSRRLDMQA